MAFLFPSLQLLSSLESISGLESVSDLESTAESLISCVCLPHSHVNTLGARPHLTQLHSPPPLLVLDKAPSPVQAGSNGLLNGKERCREFDIRY